MDIQADFFASVEALIHKAPFTWMAATCAALKAHPATATVEFVLSRIPATNNADLAFLAAELIKKSSALMSWDCLGWTLESTHRSFQHNHAEHQVELLWSGPSPADELPARRIDQALYDLIANAKQEILLVTFAAAKIDRLANELLKAHARNVQIRLILEFEQSSEGQLSYDAIRAFPANLTKAADIYFWPVEKRERNQAGRPGKLHAKIAIVDDTALVSSANLTDDAFNRNLELGVLIRNPIFLRTTRDHIETLIADGAFQVFAG